MIEISDINDERIKEFISIKDKNLIYKDLFIAETHKVIHKALESKFKVLKVLCTPDYQKENQNLLKKAEEVFILPKTEIEKVIGFKLHHGVLALVQNRPLKKLEELGDRILIFNGVTSPENVGTITRAATAFNFDSIIYDYKSASPFLRRCIRVSMGNVFQARVHKSESLIITIDKLIESGYDVIATANEEGARSLLDYTYPKKVAIIIGNEGNGMDREVIDACSRKLYIPIDKHVAHLNAASAASIFLFNSLR